MTAITPRPTSVAGRRVYLEDQFVPATVRIRDGVIASVDGFDSHADVVLDDREVLLPGLVDSHVHLDEPGRSEWEGFRTGTAAAVAGGVTTLLDMPLNSVPVTTTVDALLAKRAATTGKLAVDVGYWGGAVPENLGSLSELAKVGVVGFKCFLSPSGIDEFGHLDLQQLEQALAEVSALDALMIVHAEDPDLLAGDGPLGTRYADFLASRPPTSERAAIRSVIDASARTGARVHIVHLSAADALDDLRNAKAAGVKISVETCPHYLTLTAEEIPDGAGEFKACPPIRDGLNRDLLWEGVLDGTIDAIVSDHSPATTELKTRGDGDLGLAWGGIAGLQTGLSAVWTEARRRGIPLHKILPLFTSGPSQIGGLERRGSLSVREPAHLVVYAPDEECTVAADALEYRNKMSPWLGRRLFGTVHATYVHGAIAYTRPNGVTARNGREVLGQPRSGRLHPHAALPQPTLSQLSPPPQ